MMNPVDYIDLAFRLHEGLLQQLEAEVERAKEERRVVDVRVALHVFLGLLKGTLWSTGDLNEYEEAEIERFVDGLKVRNRPDGRKRRR